jgi:HEAT repeat protein
MISDRKPDRSVASFMATVLGLCFVAHIVGCAGKVGTTARSMLSNVRENADPNARYEAYAKLGRKRTYDNDQQITEAVAELSARLVDGKEPAISRAIICRSLGELKRPEAREALIKAMEDEDDEVRAAAARALGAVGSQEDAVLLARMMAIDTTHNGRVAAAEGLASLKPTDPNVLVSLTESLNNDDPAIRLAAYRALKSITGADPGTEADAWQDYLAKNLPGFNGQSAPERMPPKAPTQIARSSETRIPVQPQISPSDAAVRPVGLHPGDARPRTMTEGYRQAPTGPPGP